MYNEKLKIQFIQEKTTSQAKARMYKDLFGFTEYEESRLKKDICEFTISEAKPIAELITDKKGLKRNDRIIALREYAKWCLVKSVEGARDSLLVMRIAAFDGIRKRTVANPKALQKYLNAVYSPEEKQTIHNVYRCYHWMAYMGIPEDIAVRIKDTDVDFDKMIIKFDNTEYPIYAESVPAFKNCIRLKQFIMARKDGNENYQVDRCPGHVLLRGKEEPKIETLRWEMTKRIKKAYKFNKNIDVPDGYRISYHRIYVSGIFYRAWLDETSGVKLDFRAIAKEYLTDKNCENIEYNAIQAARRYEREYQSWKLSLNI